IVAVTKYLISDLEGKKGFLLAHSFRKYSPLGREDMAARLHPRKISQHSKEAPPIEDQVSKYMSL
ncbi:hypothetical protein ACQP3L_38815, partial [Escherichia coli]